MYQLMNNVVIPEANNRKTSGILKKEAEKLGERFYFTGKPCKAGHLEKRYTNNGTCFECYRLAQKKFQPKYKMKRKYNLTPEQYEQMIIDQNNLCLICEKEESTIDGKTREIKKLSIDHCHNSGKVRGLLCNSCNYAIGLLGHDVERLKRAALYCE